MIRHIWSVLCSKAVVDRDSNNVSLFEVLEAVQITTGAALEFPANVPFDGTLVTLWAREQPNVPVTAEMRIRILGPADQDLGSFSATIGLQNNPRFRNVARMSGLRCGGSGVHQFEVSWRLNDTDTWHSVASIPIELTFAVDPRVGGGAPQ